MGYQREFDPEIGEEARRACVNDAVMAGASSYALTVGTTSAALLLPAGVYAVFLQGMSAAETVALVTGEASVSAAMPVSGTPANSAVFAGSERVWLRVQPGRNWAAARTAAGSGTLFFVPLVRL